MEGWSRYGWEVGSLNCSVSYQMRALLETDRFGVRPPLEYGDLSPFFSRIRSGIAILRHSTDKSGDKSPHCKTKRRDAVPTAGASGCPPRNAAGSRKESPRVVKRVCS